MSSDDADATDRGGLADEIEKLHRLHQIGALGADEFEAAKRKVLGSAGIQPTESPEKASDTGAGDGVVPERGNLIATDAPLTGDALQVLRTLVDAGVPLTASTIVSRTRLGSERGRQGLQELTDLGYVEAHSGGRYCLAADGPPTPDLPSMESSDLRHPTGDTAAEPEAMSTRAKLAVAIIFVVVLGVAGSLFVAQRKAKDEAFLAYLHQIGIQYVDGGEAAAMGRGVCRLVDRPPGLEGVLSRLQDTNGLPPREAELVAEEAMQIYCPDKWLELERQEF